MKKLSLSILLTLPVIFSGTAFAATTLPKAPTIQTVSSMANFTAYVISMKTWIQNNYGASSMYETGFNLYIQPANNNTNKSVNGYITYPNRSSLQIISSQNSQAKQSFLENDLAVTYNAAIKNKPPFNYINYFTATVTFKGTASTCSEASKYKECQFINNY
ncbi:hypothetical protein N8865_01650 [Francisellaceae bacterium]|nr:hypothetical protein [Francisellaceae bacterium]